jgi:hypothetical protein
MEEPAHAGGKPGGEKGLNDFSSPKTSQSRVVGAISQAVLRNKSPVSPP